MDLLLIFFIIAINLFRSESNVSLGGPPIGLFIQLDSWDSPDATDLVNKLNYICQYHRSPTSGNNQSITHLVLQDIATVDTSANSFAVPPAKNTNDVLLTDWLLPLLPYFPGGNGPCNFDRVFVGSFQRNDVPAGMPQDWDPYYDGMLSAKYRGNMLARQKAIAQQFNNMVANSTNPNVQWDWYINQENSLDYSLSDPNVTNGELQFIVQQIIDFNSIRKDRVFLWSPWFTYHPSDFPVGSQEYKDLTTNLKKLFTQIPKQVAPYNAYGNNSGGPLCISLQDHVGSESTDLAFNRTGAVQWFNYLKANFPFKNLTMNVELFLDPTDPNASPSPAPCQEIYDREQFYVKQGINLGPAFELRYWDTCNHL